MYTAGMFAKKAGVTLKTIHHYDKEGVLKPSGYSQAGYRLYTDLDFEVLQKILTLKFLGFSLQDIKQVLIQESNHYNVKQSLMVQRQFINRKLIHLSLVKNAIDQTILLDKECDRYWEHLIHIINTIHQEKLGLEQYENSSNLCHRQYLHDTFSMNKRGWHHWFFEKMNLKENTNILELGCGNGSLWRRNLDQIPKGCRVTLTDLSEGMLEDAKLNLLNDHSYFKYAVMDANKIEFDDEMFDVVIADHLLYLLPNVDVALSEMYRVLKPGGQLFVTTIGTSHMLELKQLVHEFNQDLYLSNVDYAQSFGLENATHYLASYFNEVETTVYPDALKVDDVLAIVNYVLSSPGNVKATLTGDKINLFASFVRNQFNSDGDFMITKETGVLTCVKPDTNVLTLNQDHCLICNRIFMIEQNQNPYFVAELETGYVVIGDHQYFKGYTLFLCKHHETELHFLEPNFKMKFLAEMSIVAEAVYNAFEPDKLNYELLGNGDSHLHWHIFPRRVEDCVKGPVWWLERETMFSDSVVPLDEELAHMKEKLYGELIKLTIVLKTYK